VTSVATDSLAALSQRLRAVAGVLLDDVPEPHVDIAHDAANLLSALVAVARDSLRADHAWILYTAVSGHLPLPDDVDDLLRWFELSTNAVDAEIGLLRRARSAIAAHGEAGCALEVVVDAVVVDVTFSAQNDKHTGIQRVTREVCPRWNAAHDITLAAWSSGQSALRTLSPDERERVLAWTGRAGGASQRRAATPTGVSRTTTASETTPSHEPVTLVPWRCTIVLPEVAQGMTALPLAAIAQHSGNVVVAIGYDAIPVVSADLRPVPEPNQFVRYLTVIKHARRVAGISKSSAAEFRGFSQAVSAQGLAGPEVSEIQLAAEVPMTAGAPDPATSPKSPGKEPGARRILCVGSHELHKNHLAVLHAAELLWREGQRFELIFIGGPGWDTRGFDSRLAELTAQGRPITNLGSVSDDQLWSLYREAMFSVFPSLHEGFGLPVAESLACGTPVITTCYGSTEEIAERGGCLLADPLDDHDLVRAMRTLLTDDTVYDRLRREAHAVVPRTWDTYAAEVWDCLVEDTGSTG